MIRPGYVPAARLRPDTFTWDRKPIALAPRHRLDQLIAGIRQSDAALRRAGKKVAAL